MDVLSAPNGLDVSLRPFEDEDITMLTTWLYEDYVIKWCHDPNNWLIEVKGRHTTYPWIHHFIVMVGDTPIGFCQYYDCYNANDIEDWYDVTERNDTFSIDYLIGEKNFLGKGCGKKIVKYLTEMIRRKNAKQIIVQPDLENRSSTGVLISNGYIYDKQKQYYVKLLNK